LEESSNVFGETENCGIGSIVGSCSDELLSLLQESITIISSVGITQYFMRNKLGTMIIKIFGRPGKTQVRRSGVLCLYELFD